MIEILRFFLRCFLQREKCLKSKRKKDNVKAALKMLLEEKTTIRQVAQAFHVPRKKKTSIGLLVDICKDVQIKCLSRY